MDCLWPRTDILLTLTGSDVPVKILPMFVSGIWVGFYGWSILQFSSGSFCVHCIHMSGLRLPPQHVIHCHFWYNGKCKYIYECCSRWSSHVRLSICQLTKEFSWKTGDFNTDHSCWCYNMTVYLTNNDFMHMILWLVCFISSDRLQCCELSWLTTGSALWG